MARLLLIEDNPDSLELMALLVGAAGHLALTAGDGASGLALAQAELPDLIVCDVQMPGMDGFAVARQLKSEPQLQAIPLVAVTALAMPADRSEILAAGFDGYIAKPINPEEFVLQLETFLPDELFPLSWSSEALLDGGERQGAQILVVDDSATNRELVRIILEPFGYGIVAAGNVIQAMEQLMSRPFDLVVSDLQLHEEDGMAFLTVMRADPRLTRLPFILFSSAEWDGAARERARELGVEHFLTRPIEPQGLLDAVAECLSERKERGRGQDPGR
jgi:two-component system cell cycle response regulator